MKFRNSLFGRTPTVSSAGSRTPSLSDSSLSSAATSSHSSASSRASKGGRSLLSRSKSAKFSDDEVCNLTFTPLAELKKYGETPYRSRDDGLMYSREQLTRYLGYQLEQKGPQGLTSPLSGASMRKDARNLRVYATQPPRLSARGLLASAQKAGEAWLGYRIYTQQTGGVFG